MVNLKNYWIFHSALAVLLLLPFSSASYAGLMDTAGAANVSSTGAANYEIPLMIPPSINGIGPAISIAYSSESGNGLLGVGWMMSGFSVISRCPRTVAQDGINGSVNLDVNDRYCLDGKRLIAINGTYGAPNTEYRTELDSFSRIIGYGGATGNNDYFRVWTKNGQILEFGNTNDSRIEYQGKAIIRLWALSKLSDRAGNYASWHYSEDNTNGDYYPDQILYTANSVTGVSANSSLSLVYELRPDVTPQYFKGSLMKGLKRLLRIEAYTSGEKVKEYRLGYNLSSATKRSRLSTFQECDNTGVCKPAVSLAWQEGPSSLYTESDVGVTMAGVTSSSNVILGDFNGDGKSDAYSFVAGTGHAVYLNDGVGNLSSSPSWSSAGPVATTGFTAQLGDFNGDSKPDIFLNNVVTGEQIVWLNVGDGTFPATYSWQSGTGYSIGFEAQLVDFNGDGLTDLYFFNKTTGEHQIALNIGNGVFTGYSWTSGAGFGAGYDALISDLNADGKPDIFLYSSQDGLYKVWLNNGDGTFPSVFSVQSGTGKGLSNSGVTFGAYLGDFNGDGSVDLYIYSPNSSYIPFNVPIGASYVLLNDGNGNFLAPSYLGAIPFNPNSQTFSVQLGDFNGDGKADIMFIPDTSIYGGYNIIWLNNGDGTFPLTASWVSSLNYLSFGTLRVGDFNGDGKLDLHFLGKMPWLMNGIAADLLSSVNNGLARSTSFTYKPLTDSTVYTKGTGAIYPQVDLQDPDFVVSQLSVTNGIGGSFITNYQYSSLKADMTGRGLLGFGTMRSTSVNTGISVQTDFRQDWPYIGQPSQTKKTLPAAVEASDRLSQVTNTFACLNPATGAACTVVAGNRYFPYASKTEEKAWDLNGVALPVVTTTNTVDSYGNATQVKVSTPDSYSKTTTNTYTNDTTNSNWFLGRLIKSTVTSVTP